MSTVALVMMISFYRTWTRPVVAAMLAFALIVLFAVFMIYAETQRQRIRREAEQREREQLQANNALQASDAGAPQPER